ncbi:MAG: hypothetical protein NTW86_14015 [Candidatus Sumerlaeota bacterium]|nr:hypothetical protein [Candidatus Sumerlaeota bacterium]
MATEGKPQNAPIAELKEGAAAATFSPREGGAKLDALYLTADPEARPPEKP